MTDKRFKPFHRQYYNGITDNKTGKEYKFSYLIKYPDLRMFAMMLNDVIE